MQMQEKETKKPFDVDADNAWGGAGLTITMMTIMTTRFFLLSIKMMENENKMQERANRGNEILIIIKIEKKKKQRNRLRLEELACRINIDFKVIW